MVFLRLFVLPVLCVLLAGCCGDLLCPQKVQEPWGATKSAYSYDGKFLAVARPGAITIYDAQNNSVSENLTATCRPFDDFVWLPDGRMVTTQPIPCDYYVTNSILAFWDMKNFLDVKNPVPVQIPAHTMTFDTGIVTAPSPAVLASSPIGHVALSYVYYNESGGMHFHNVAILDAATYAPLKNITLELGRDELEISYSPDGEYFMVGGSKLPPENSFGYIFYSTSDYDQIYNFSADSLSQLSWSRDGTTMAGVTLGNAGHNTVTIFSVCQGNDSFQLVPIGTYRIDVNDSFHGYYPDVNNIAFSPDSRYIAITGAHSISACPSVPGVCSLGFIDVFDVQSKKVVFWADGGTQRENYAFSYWLPDGKLAYLFSDEPREKLRIVNPANFTAG